MEKGHQLAMMASVAHIVNADWDSFVQDLADMEVLPAYVNRRAIALVYVYQLLFVSTLWREDSNSWRHFVQELVEALGDVVPQEGVPDIKFSKVKWAY